MSDIEVTRTEFAKLAGCTPDRVTRYIAEGMPVAKTGSGRGHKTTINLAHALPWLLQRKANAVDDQRARYYRLQSDKLQQELQARTDELLAVTDVERRWAAIVAAVRSRFLNLPSLALQRRVVDANGEDVLVSLVDDALSELAAMPRAK